MSLTSDLLLSSVPLKYNYYSSHRLFFFYSSGDHRDLHSFPTRRSSDLLASNELLHQLITTRHVVYGAMMIMDRALAAKRSEEHTSELQSRFDLVCRLLLEKKKKNNHKLSLHKRHIAFYKLIQSTTPTHV